MKRMKKTETTGTVNRVYKSRIFEMLFSDRKELLSLYNAVNGTDYDDPEQLEINTLENAIYMAMHNDISFIIDLRLNLYEHQSTYNPNLPLRCLFYISDLYSEITKNANLYGTRLVRLPTPRFIVFYNGIEERPDKEILKLSSAFQIQEEEVFLELTVAALNINLGHNEALLKMCKTLRDYAVYTERIRTYAQEMELETAVECAIEACIREGVLLEFLKKNRAEAKKVSIYEYDYEKHMRQEREENHQAGLEEGLRAGAEEKLKALIAKKLQKGMNAEQIAELFEEELDTVKRLVQEIRKQGETSSCHNSNGGK